MGCCQADCVGLPWNRHSSELEHRSGLPTDSSDWYVVLSLYVIRLTCIAPGTSSCNSCQVHEGFQKQYNALAPAAISAVQSAIKSTGYSFILTGHSLGGALAALATASFGGSGVKIAATYTYGEPRNGNSNYGSYVIQQTGANNYYRVTHSNDGVPSIPPSAIGFSHHGNEYWQKATGYNNTLATVVECASVFNQEPLVSYPNPHEIAADFDESSATLEQAPETIPSTMLT